MRSALAAAAVSWTALGLRWRGFAPTCGELLAPAPEGIAGAEADPGIDGLVRAYLRTAVLPWSSCLSRSAALCRALRRRGVPALLKIGALPAPDGLRAHAWVELDGRPLSDPPGVARDFAVLSPP